jgi:hypothetical protein
MTGIVSSVEQLVAAVRLNEAKQTYRLVRAEVLTVGDVVSWMKTWREPDDTLVWFDPNEGPDASEERNRTVRYWAFLRWLHKAEWASKGGQP